MTTTQRDFSTNRRSQRIIASPRARRALAQRQIDSSKLQGRGPGGRILEADVLEYAAAPAAQPTAGVFASAVEYLRAEIDASRLAELQTKFLPYAQKKGGSFALTDVLLKAVSESLRSQPELSGDIAFYSESVKVLPVLPGDARLNLLEIATRRAEITAAAGDSPQQNAAIALFDTGAGRADEWTPSLSPNYNIALGVGGLAKRPIAQGDDLSIRPTLRLCFAYSADSVSRAAVSELLDQVVNYLEEPEALVFS